jgi:glyoxylase-like metal-dependent hydrolase (beta-lactamase superfamily II)
MKNKKIFIILTLFLLAISPSVVLGAGQQKVNFKLEKVAKNVYCLYGAGGNIGILKGDKSFLVVDAQYARSANEALAQIHTLGKMPVRYLINTHYHGDHTSGNPILGKGANIIAHNNCKTSFLKGLKPEQNPADMGIPKTTYNGKMELKLGKHAIHLLHFGPGHTAGDTVVVFPDAKVIHTGDLFFHGMPPYIDVRDGANTKNWISTIKKLAKKFPDYRVIPGHGQVTDMRSYLAFADYLSYLRKQVAAAIKAGKSRQQAVDTIDLSPYGHLKDKGTFITKKNNIGWVYDELSGKK